MPVNKEFSVVADSTRSSSPPYNSTSKSIKTARPTRTYGRQREAVEDPDTSFTISETSCSSSSKDSTFRTGPLHTDEEIPPSSDPARPTSYHIEEDDEDDENTSPFNFCGGIKTKLIDTASDAKENDTGIRSPSNASPFQFDFRRKLAQIDAEIDASEPLGEEASGDRKPRFGVPLFLSAVNNTVEAHDKTCPNSPVAPEHINISDTLSSLPDSSIAGSSVAKFPTPARRPTRAGKRAVIHDSDSESGASQINERTPSTSTSPAHPHPITTPKLRSSPTPPTSDDELPSRLAPKLTFKGKGKSISTRRNVPPLRFDEGMISDSMESHNNSGLKRKRGPSKIKAPTKKDRKETELERVRLAVDRQINIPKLDNSHNYSIRNLFSSLGPGHASSDPITTFSSPSHRRQDIEGTRVPDDNLGSNSREPRPVTPLQTDLPPPASDSDSEMPSIEEIAKERQLQELRERKTLYVDRMSHRVMEDDDDELEIIPSEETREGIKNEEKLLPGPKTVSLGRKLQLQLANIGPARQKKQENAQLLRTRHASDQGFSRLLKATNLDLPGHERAGLDQGELNKVLAMRMDNNIAKLTQEKEEEWKRRGGRLQLGPEIEGGDMAADDAWDAYIKKGLKAAEARAVSGHMDVDDEVEEDGDASDEDWRPEMRGSASPQPGEEEEVTMVNDSNELEVSDEDAEAEGNINQLSTLRRRTIVDSDNDSDSENVRPTRKTAIDFSNVLSQDEDSEDVVREPAALSVIAHRRSTSTLGESNEDENDKENNTRLMFDRSEDKENKAVVRHGTSSRVPLNGLTFSLEREHFPPYADFNDAEDIKENDGRKPLKDLLASDSPRASEYGASSLTQSFTVQLQQSPIVSSLSPSLKPLFKADGITSVTDFTPMSEDGDIFRAAPLQAGFSELFEAGTERQKTSTSHEDDGAIGPDPKFTNLRQLARSDTLDLTQDIGLQPAFQAGEQLLRKADVIFEKEQEYLLEAAVKKPLKKPELYVNDHGFLTQTKPEVGSPDIYRVISPSQRAYGTQRLLKDAQQIQRTPLRTLSFSGTIDLESPEQAPLRRLKRVVSPRSFDVGNRSSPSVSPRVSHDPANAFDVLARGAVKAYTKQKRPLERSEFVEAEAQESDDDERLGFGLAKGNENEGEEDGEDLDKTLETLVDDQEMDDETVAADKVKEKFMEQEEEQDKEIEKLHQAAIQGELRRKKRHHGVGINDSDEDSDEDEQNRRIRRQMNKRRKIDRANIKALGENEETRAFYNTYEQDLHDEPVDFDAPSHHDNRMIDVDEDRGDDDRYITQEEIARQVREVAERDEEMKERDPYDVSWVDGDEDDQDAHVRVKIVSANRKRGTWAQKDHSEFDEGLERKKFGTDEHKQKQQKSWYIDHSRSRNQGTSRRTEGAAVTGHGKSKVKAGGGSVRQESTSGSVASSRSTKPIKAAASVLAGLDRSARFG